MFKFMFNKIIFRFINLKILLIFIEFNIIKEKIIRIYINSVIRENIINKNIIIKLFNFLKIINLGKNPKKGGSPPNDKKFIKINNLKNLKLLFKL